MPVHLRTLGPWDKSAVEHGCARARPKDCAPGCTDDGCGFGRDAEDGNPQPGAPFLTRASRLHKAAERVEVGSLDGTSGRHRDSYDDILNRHVKSEGLALLADPFEAIEGSMNLADSPQMHCR
jgi:hypothetical protein